MRVEMNKFEEITMTETQTVNGGGLVGGILGGTLGLVVGTVASIVNKDTSGETLYKNTVAFGLSGVAIGAWAPL